MLLDNVSHRTPSPLGAIFFFEPDFTHCQTRCMCDYQVFKDRTVTLSRLAQPNVTVLSRRSRSQRPEAF